ncbi:hypothetical protein P8936_06425 [Edaphobacter paludis]|uniref:DUF4760 domain-containing protein n=1 Tax=Edaphobacter paludis TaxID=3035702 RepID=A0AAU7DBS1_9BACT
MAFHTTVHTLQVILGWLAKMAAIWFAISVISITLILFAVHAWSLLLRLKVKMDEFDRTMPLPLFDRRRKKHPKFNLRLTRRQFSRTEGEMFEKLDHAIDYLIDTYDLRKFSGIRNELLPDEFIAAQRLLQCRAEMLKEYTPLPSLSYLLKRRLAYLMNRRQTWV